MDRFKEIFNELIVKTVQESYRFVIQFLPKLAVVVIILLTGWVCAILFKKILSRTLKALGFDVLAEKTRLKEFLEKGGVRRSFSLLVGTVFYWIIIFATLMMIFNTLELEAASRLIDQVIFYIPKTIVALILLALGVFLSKFVGKFVQTSAHLAQLSLYASIGKIARYVIIGLAVIVAAESLGVAAGIIVQYSFIIFGVIPLIVCLTFLIGGKDIVSNLLTQRFLVREYKVGDTIEVDSMSGKISSIDTITTKITDGEKEIIIPNSELAKKIVKRLKR